MFGFNNPLGQAPGMRSALRNNSDMLLQTGMGLLGGRTGPEQFALGMQGMQAGRQLVRDRQAKNQTVEWLRGVNPELASAVERGALTPGDAYKMQWQAQQKARAPQEVRRSLNPIYGTDAQGNQVLLQANDAGSVERMAMPEGVSLSTGVDRVDAGTHFVLIDKRTGQSVGTIPKENFQESFDSSRGSAEGKAAGESAASANSDAEKAQQGIQVIDGILNAPGLDGAVGTIQGRLPDILLGQDATNARVRIEQLQGQTFLRAYQDLKGGGHITEIEGAKAENAIARLQLRQSDEEYRRALLELRDIFIIGYERALGAGAAPQPIPAAPVDAEPSTRNISEMTDAELEAIINGQ